MCNDGVNWFSFVFQASFKYQEYFLRPMMNYVIDRNSDVRQVCLFIYLFIYLFIVFFVQ